ncbi:S49 family peptidase [Actinokineospora bangkokensis]|uniref:S49 family peptidase n=1 Tax=Actinokineospora bangkokensis TaxID=1193682 RepID=A0A1Q9LU98_9PSEU|nr:S49 family peptidase [Actinokineospora bangkokensis]OLR95581.1 S49 family peptidase [Actinokineospora bangkokensis]
MSVAEKLAARLPGIGERGEKGDVVSVVRLHGIISPSASPLARGAINVSSVESALSRAFERDRLVAVALVVNSPGGAPTQSALVAERVQELAGKKGVPVLAFCEDVAASGGYWLACAGDEIFAHPTSQVGSIGVVSAGFGLNNLLERFGVERRVHTAGANKVRLDPFQPESPEDVAWLRGLQAELHEQFVAWVRERRGDKLTGDPDVLFSGEVWTGARAQELGLVDGLGSVRSVVAQRFPGAELVLAEPKKALLARLGLGGPMSAGDRVLAAIEGVENRVTWNRFGL